MVYDDELYLLATAVCLVLRLGSELPRFLPVNIRPPPEGGLGCDEETFFREMLKIEKKISKPNTKLVLCRKIPKVSPKNITS